MLRKCAGSLRVLLIDLLAYLLSGANLSLAIFPLFRDSIPFHPTDLELLLPL
jgi:hypothetical protein